MGVSDAVTAGFTLFTNGGAREARFHSRAVCQAAIAVVEVAIVADLGALDLPVAASGTCFARNVAGVTFLDGAEVTAAITVVEVRVVAFLGALVDAVAALFAGEAGLGAGEAFLGLAVVGAAVTVLVVAVVALFAFIKGAVTTAVDDRGSATGCRARLATATNIDDVTCPGSGKVWCIALTTSSSPALFSLSTWVAIHLGVVTASEGQRFQCDQRREKSEQARLRHGRVFRWQWNGSQLRELGLRYNDAREVDLIVSG